MKTTVLSVGGQVASAQCSIANVLHTCAKTPMQRALVLRVSRCGFG